MWWYVRSRGCVLYILLYQVLLSTLEHSESLESQLSVLACFSELTRQLEQRMRLLASSPAAADSYTMEIDGVCVCVWCGMVWYIVIWCVCVMCILYIHVCVWVWVCICQYGARIGNTYVLSSVSCCFSYDSWELHMENLFSLYFIQLFTVEA